MCEVQNDLTKLFQSADESNVPEKFPIEGKLPQWLSGSVVRIGPGLFDFENFSMRHYLDGYAILSKFEISKDYVTFQKKFLQSDSYKRAIRAQKPVVIEFGTKAYPEKGKSLLSRFMSTIIPEMSDNNNCNIFEFEQELYAANDACFFRKIDHKSLESGERYDSNKLFGLNGWTSHPLTDAQGNMYNIGFSILSGLKFYLVKIHPSSASQKNAKETFKNAKVLCTIPSSFHAGISFTHSFGMSENYFCFVEQPFVAAVSAIAKALVKGYSAKEWMEWRPKEKNRFHIIEKATGKVIKIEYFSSEPFFFLHFVNCFENSNNQIVADIIAFNDPTILDGMYLSKLRNNIVENVSQPTCRRFVIPLSIPKGGREGSNVLGNSPAKAVRYGDSKLILTPQILTEPGCGLSCINHNFATKNYQYFYVSGTIAQNSFSHSISKFDIIRQHRSVWRGNTGSYPGPPIFIANPSSQNEDDGIIVSLVYDIRKQSKDFLVFIDANKMVEVARVEFDSHVNIPGALHEIFIPSN